MCYSIIIENTQSKPKIQIMQEKQLELNKIL